MSAGRISSRYRVFRRAGGAAVWVLISGSSGGSARRWAVAGAGRQGRREEGVPPAHRRPRTPPAGDQRPIQRCGDSLEGPLELRSRTGRRAQPLAVLDDRLHARGLLVLRIAQGDVREVDRALPLDDAARLHRAGARARVALDDVQALDVDALLARVDAQHLALLAAVLAADDDDLVALDDARGHGYSTSGASDTIFMKLRSRSSRATGPKMRVPRGLLAASMMTAAFSSKAMYVPSLRPNGFFVRTTTARTTSPFLTVPCGLACLTVAVMTSPTPA